MYVLVLVACMSFSGETHCQNFERDHAFASENRCRVAAAIERGQYSERSQSRKDWLTYDWQCRPSQVTMLGDKAE
jgi:hypothetical protein